MKTNQKIFCALMVIILVAATILSFAQTRDSIVARTVTKTVPVTHDSSYIKTVTVNHDSTYSYITYDTFKVSVPVVLKGMYTHPNQVTIGSSTSENSYLTWCKREGVNMLNCYARSYLYDATKRAQLYAFEQKAKTYGVILMTVDVRFTDSRELPGWQAFYASYPNTIIEPLTENEPWIKNSSGVYDYATFYTLVRTMGNLAHSKGKKLNYYEGWVGNNGCGDGCFLQAAVDSMVKYSDRVFLSNYVSVSDYNSTSTSLGKWDNRMDKRCSTISVSCPKFNKTMDIVEIVSLEQKIWGAASDFLGSLFVTRSFYGSTYTDDINAYTNFSTPAVLQYTDVTGRCIFYSKYARLAHP